MRPADPCQRADGDRGHGGCRGRAPSDYQVLPALDACAGPDWSALAAFPASLCTVASEVACRPARAAARAPCSLPCLAALPAESGMAPLPWPLQGVPAEAA